MRKSNKVGLLADQILYSAGSFAFSLLSARHLQDPATFALLGLVVLIGVVIQGVVRSVCFFPLANPKDPLPVGQGRSALIVVALSPSMIAGVLLAGSVLTAREAVIACLGLTLVSAHDSARLISLAEGKAPLALLSEAIWALPLLVLFAIPVSNEGGSLIVVLSCYAACGFLGLSVLLLKASREAMSFRVLLGRRTRSAVVTIVEQLVGTSANLLLIAIVTSASAALAGDIRLAFVLVGPAGVVVQGLSNLLAIRQSPDKKRTALGFSLSVSAAFYTLAIAAIALPLVKRIIGEVIPGDFTLNYLVPIAVLTGAEALLLLVVASLRADGLVMKALGLRSIALAAFVTAGLYPQPPVIYIVSGALALCALLVSARSLERRGEAYA